MEEVEEDGRLILTLRSPIHKLQWTGTDFKSSWYYKRQCRTYDAWLWP